MKSAWKSGPESGHLAFADQNIRRHGFSRWRPQPVLWSVIVAAFAFALLPRSIAGLTTNLFEGFENELAGWSIGDADPASGTSYWAPVAASFGGEGAHQGNFKGYCAGFGHSGSEDYPLYSPNMSAFLSRALDLTHQTNATLTFWFKLPEIEQRFDFARVFINQVQIWRSDQPQPAWQLVTLNLDEFIGKTNTLTFEFTSDDSVSYEGCYLDDITVTDAYSAPPPPHNDNFSSAMLLVGSSGSIQATTRGATIQRIDQDATFAPEEPNPGNSVWFSWRASTNGDVTFGVLASNTSSRICAYTGTQLANLSSVGCSSLTPPNQSAFITFAALEETTYHIAVSSTDPSQGPFLLSWEQPDGLGSPLLPDLTVWASESENYLYGWYLDRLEQPGRVLLRTSTGTPNIGTGPLELAGSTTSPDVFQRILRTDGGWSERFAGTFTFHPAHGHLHFDNWVKLNLRALGGGGEPAELVAGGAKTSFAIIDIKQYDLDLPGSPSSSVYEDGGLIQGISVGWADVYVASLPDQWIDVTDVPSGRYWLEAVVDPENKILESDESNNVTRILIDFTQPATGDEHPLNDDFTSAIVISEITAGALGNNFNATHEPGEPQHLANDVSSKSVWWQWRCPSNVHAVITTEGSSFDTVLAIYTGTSFNDLALVASDDDSGSDKASRVEFDAEANTTYWLAVDGFSDAEGSILLHINPAWNDDFSRCITLHGLLESTTGSNEEATAEPGEPASPGGAGSNSIWYCWTAPIDGPVAFDASESSFDAVVLVYTGSQLSALTPVARMGGNGPTNLFQFTARKDTTYRVAIVGFEGASGVVKLRWSGPSTPFLISQPAGTNVVAGAAACLRVVAIGSDPLTFHWQRSGTNLLDDTYLRGTSSDTLCLVKALEPYAGLYSVIVSNSFGSVTSAMASVMVLQNPRVVYLPEVDGFIGSVVVLPIYLRPTGVENSFHFSLQFDPFILSNPRILAGVDLQNGVVSVDNSQLNSGGLGINLSLASGVTAVPGADRELARVLLDISPTAPEGTETGVAFTDSPTPRIVANTANLPLTTLFAPGLVSLERLQEQLFVIGTQNGAFQFRAYGRPGRRYAIEASIDLQRWEVTTTILLDLEGESNGTIPMSPVVTQQFYRMRLAP